MEKDAKEDEDVSDEDELRNESSAVAQERQEDEERHEKTKKKKRAEAALPWMRVPLDIPADGDVDLADLPGLNPRVRGALEADGLDRIFAVQAATWRHTGGGMRFDRDLCVCAPTGSGKTLAYALPIVQALAGRTNVRRSLRALVIVPTGDLALQVAEVFTPLCKAAGLRVGVAHGPGNHRNARSGRGSGGRGAGGANRKSVANDVYLPRISRTAGIETHEDEEEDGGVGGTGGGTGGTGVDVLVTPPGRLVAHVRETPGFSLSSLEFLVVDEADRILRQEYQGWLPLVVAGAGARPPRMAVGERGRSARRVRKLLVSATLTRDPARLVGLNLHAPRMLTAVTTDAAGDSRYLLPDRLEEHVVVAKGDDKPLALCALLTRLGGDVPIIVFTASVDATHRLCLLLDAIGGLPSRPVEYSSFAPQSRRAAALESFRSGATRLLIASDAATRGLDVEGVGAVISYDAPTHLKTYVHRVGRTARAGRRGSAYTLCRPSEENKFRSMLAKVEGQRSRQPPGKLELETDETEAFAGRLRPALVSVKLSLEAGEAGNWSSGGGSGNGGSTKDGGGDIMAAARVAADQASRNFRRFLV